MGYIYILFTIIFTVYGQIILKWRINNIQFKLSDGLFDKVLDIIKLLFDMYVFSGFLSAFIASLFWIAAMSKLDITIAYPFMSLAPVLVFVIGVIFLNEEFTWGKVIGLGFIIVGLLITVKF
ncbi:MAG: undecaprenyl phosphate-alpha-L-ara4N flippase subunit ArnF [Polaribacter sp.]|jgi:undecaprenyl phosphate-alpha-L-ara4N flippase subunit ArnF|tara:strand:+ start:3832 stop:4197 length:366 start_codon:yes stop_codon:yes gene_type:complete